MNPYLMPVLIQKSADLVPLVEEMRRIAREQPVVEKQKFGESAEAVMEEMRLHSEISKDDRTGTGFDTGQCRFLVIPGVPPKEAVKVPSNVPLIPITVELTLDLYNEKCRWNFSCSVSCKPPHHPAKVEASLARGLANAFLGPGFVEIEPEGAIKTINQFILEELPLPAE